MSQLFESGGQTIRNFSFSISPSNEYSELISFRTDWLNLAVQGTLKSPLQHHSSKALILQHSAFFMVQLSIHTQLLEKTIALTICTFVSKVMSLLFNMQYRLFIGFPGGSDDKASAYNVGDPGLIPRLGRSTGEGNGNPLQYSCLETPMDGEAW